MVKEILLRFQELQLSGEHQVGNKTLDLKSMLQAIETDLVSNIWKVSGELCISQSSVVCHLHNLGKNCYQNIAKLLPHPDINDSIVKISLTNISYDKNSISYLY